MIKSGYDIWTDIDSDTTDLESENHPYNTKWIKVSDVVLILDPIIEPIDKATFKEVFERRLSLLTFGVPPTS